MEYSYFKQPTQEQILELKQILESQNNTQYEMKEIREIAEKLIEFYSLLAQIHIEISTANQEREK